MKKLMLIVSLALSLMVAAPAFSLPWVHLVSEVARWDYTICLYEDRDTGTIYQTRIGKWDRCDSTVEIDEDQGRQHARKIKH